MKTRWFQFRLRTLLSVLTLVAVSTGLMVQHVRFVQQRIRYHEERLTSCEQAIMMREDLDWLRDRWRKSDTKDVDPHLPEGHLLFNPPASVWSKRRDIGTIMQEVDRETAVLGASKTYHQGQIEQYKESLWRPWIRVKETRELILDSPLENLPELPESPMSPPWESDRESLVKQLEVMQSERELLLKRLEVESVNLPPRTKLRSPWRSIDRPLPHDFDKRNVQVEKAAAV